MNPLVRMGRALLQWFDTSRSSSFNDDAKEQPGADRIDWMRTLPFILMHAACLFVFVVGVSPIALTVCAALYFVRMFAITGFYHRYFSHKSFKTSRVGQFLFGVLGSSAVQRGPIWWAAHHREHHQYSD
jgi:stearoyl-CoA desaturase (delta-9 desaturase)